MPNRSLWSAWRPVVRSSRKSFRTTRPGVPRAEIVVRTLFQIRERPGPGSQRAAARVPAFFGWNARNRLISEDAEAQKKGEGRRWTNGRACGRTNERANERRQRQKLLQRRKKRKKKRCATVGGVRSLLRTTRTLRGSASVVLVPSSHWPVPKRTNKREIGLPPFSLSLSFFLTVVNTVAEKERRKRDGEVPHKRHRADGKERRT